MIPGDHVPHIAWTCKRCAGQAQISSKEVGMFREGKTSWEKEGTTPECVLSAPGQSPSEH